MTLTAENIKQLLSLQPGASYALLGTSEWPGVEPPDVELGDPDQLAQAYPAQRQAIAVFTEAQASSR